MNRFHSPVFRDEHLRSAIFVSICVASTLQFSRKPKEKSDDRRSHRALRSFVVAIGAMFIAHALLKVFVFTLPGTVQYFESVGLPGVLAYVTIAAELVGGLMLVLGVGTRWAAALLIPVLLGAAWTHAPNGWLFTAANGGWEYPVLERCSPRTGAAWRRCLRAFVCIHFKPAVRLRTA